MLCGSAAFGFTCLKAAFIIAPSCCQFQGQKCQEIVKKAVFFGKIEYFNVTFLQT